MSSPFFLSNDTRAERFLPYMQDQRLIISFMTEAELERWVLQSNWGAMRVQRFRDFMTRFVVIPSSRDLILKWAEVMVAARSVGRRIDFDKQSHGLFRRSWSNNDTRTVARSTPFPPTAIPHTDPHAWRSPPATAPGASPPWRPSPPPPPDSASPQGLSPYRSTSPASPALPKSNTYTARSAASANRRIRSPAPSANPPNSSHSAPAAPPAA